MRQDYLDPEGFGDHLLHRVLQLDVLELEAVAGVEKQAVGLEVVTHLPVGLPSSQQRESRSQGDVH
jgi:hypothetical protein